MDLWQAIQEAPIWIKVLLVITELAAFYTACRLLLPTLFRWWQMGLSRLRAVIKRIREFMIWISNKPSIQLLEEFSNIEVKMEKDIQIWSAQFKFRLQSRDKEQPTDVNFQYAELLLVQGWGMRAKTTTLNTNFTGGASTVRLQPKGMQESIQDITVIFKKTTIHQDSYALIDLEQPYKWHTSNITVRVYPLFLRELPQFEGVRHAK